jgi:hypothetical protein
VDNSDGTDLLSSVIIILIFRKSLEGVGSVNGQRATEDFVGFQRMVPMLGGGGTKQSRHHQR